MNRTDIIEKAESGEHLGLAELECLLDIDEAEDIDKLMRAARRVRDRNFGRSVFLYGFVYFSTYCHNSCNFCLYRQGNPHATRYRKKAEEVLHIASMLRQDGVHLVDLTMGEDLYYQQGEGVAELRRMVHGAKNVIDVPVMVSAGVLSQHNIGMMARAGADWIACYQETHTPSLFHRLRPGQDYGMRLEQKTWAMQNGLLSEEGVLIGVGESRSDLARSVSEMGRLGVQQVRAMAFVPQEGTPLERSRPGRVEDELKIIAIMRLAHPEKLIPASLDVEGIDGLLPRLDAGANVVTSIIPNDSGLRGVANQALEISSGGRSVKAVLKRLELGSYRASSRSDYEAWIESNRPSVQEAS